MIAIGWNGMEMGPGPPNVLCGDKDGWNGTPE